MKHVHIVSSSEARQYLRDLLDETVFNYTLTIITRYGKPIVAVLPYEDYAAISHLIPLTKEGEKHDPTTL